MRRPIVILVALLAGCGRTAESPVGSKHEHKAPHGGALIELGEEFAHVELVVENETGRLTAYALDGEAEKPVRLTQERMEFQLVAGSRTVDVPLSAVASKLTGETAGNSSEFAGSCDALKGIARFEGHLKAVTVKGTEFRDVAFRFPEGNEK